jgi:hypothetical protein
MPGFQSLGVLAEEGLILERWDGRASRFIDCGISGVRNNACGQAKQGDRLLSAGRLHSVFFEPFQVGAVFFAEMDCHGVWSSTAIVRCVEA